MWRTEKTPNGTQDLVWDAVEQGIAPSPTKGTANIQNANISTELGEVMCSYARTPQWIPTPTITGGTLTASGGAGTTLLAAPSNLYAGMWINITSSTITTTPASTTVNALVVAGGGGGAEPSHTIGYPAGGGGAGGYLSLPTHTVQNGVAYPVTVGAGGTGATAEDTVGLNGSDSIFDTITATGGGGGGTIGGSNVNGANGGSGGGGPTGGTAAPGQGHNGGISASSGNGGAGGGGGAGAVGQAGSGTGFGTGGNGGNGTSNSITGSSVTYAGGGGGGAFTTGTAGSGGTGGGGAGNTNTSNGVAGSANTGGGGGAGGQGAGGAGHGGNGGSGVVIIAYPTAAMTATGGSITTSGSNTIHTFTTNGTFTVTSITGTTLSGYYYVSYRNGSSQVKISTSYDPTGSSAVAHGTTGTATFSTLVQALGSPINKATEPYSDGTTQQYRYYILDSTGYVWVYDTGLYARTLAASGTGTTWFLPDITDYSTSAFTGMAILNGWLMVLTYASIYAKSTSNLGAGFAGLTNVGMNNPFPGHTNFAYVGHQGKMYYTDGNYIGSIFPTTSLVTSQANVQSYVSYTGGNPNSTINAIIGGSLPYTTDSSGATVRTPAVFFTDANGTQPTNLTAGTVYYILSGPAQTSFQVYAAITGGSAIDVTLGASGNQYFNTFYPFGGDAGVGGSHPLLTYSNQRLNLPFFETAQCMVEVGNTIIIGCQGNTLYPWNQINALPSDLIALPESNVKNMINVNNMAYIFAGNKGNIYITNNSVASLVLKVPDYCAGIPGTATSYIEPVFTWGDAMYLRGRVYFSILDQTSTKVGNCGGVWSFIPTQNFYVGQDIGTALRLENQNSYGTYNGLATVLLPNQVQTTIAPQFWSGWYSSISNPTYGIDTTSTVSSITAYVETDLTPTGTLLGNQTFGQVEYKLTTPLATSESVQLYYRKNSTDAYATCGTVNLISTDPISGYFSMDFESTQWVQFQAKLTSNGLTTSSFVRLKEIRLR